MMKRSAAIEPTIRCRSAFVLRASVRLAGWHAAWLACASEMLVIVGDSWPVTVNLNNSGKNKAKNNI